LACIHAALGALSTLSGSTTARQLCVQPAQSCHEIGTYGEAVI
jgi:hypothetical protein